jgi:hypothetical protein
MGYDMRMMNSPSVPLKGYRPQDEDDPGYFQFRNIGMAAMLDIMEAAGVVDGTAKHDELPDWPPNGLSNDRADELGPFVFDDIEVPSPPTATEMLIIEDWRSAADIVLGTKSARPGKVPAYKFMSNDGWIVWPEECLSISNALCKALATKPERILPDQKISGIKPNEAAEWILSWASYNEVAAKHGGYRVR